MQVTYTNEEANAAIQLYDMAVKSNGMVVAEVAILLTKKIQDAAKEIPVETTNE